MPDCASRIWDVDAAADYAVGLLLWLDRSVSERELHKNEKKWRHDVILTPRMADAVTQEEVRKDG